MPTTHEIAEFDRSYAMAGVDKLVHFSGADAPRIDSLQPESLLIESWGDVDKTDDRRCWEHLAAHNLVVAAWTVLDPNVPEPVSQSDDGAPGDRQLWEIKLIIESDDPHEVERLAGAVALAASRG